MLQDNWYENDKFVHFVFGKQVGNIDVHSAFFQLFRDRLTLLLFLYTYWGVNIFLLFTFL